MKRLLFLGLILWTACGPDRSAPFIDRAKLVDLSHDYGPDSIYWPTAPPFERKVDAYGVTAGGFWYASGTVITSEHGGTHLDSPIHFAEGKWAAANIPIDRLAGPADVIDITAACQEDRNYLMRPSDIEAWESEHGSIAAGDIVVVRMGWSRYWPDQLAYMGSDTPGDAANLSFPGISREAAELLVQRQAAGVGIDTASLDHGPSKDFQTHRVLTAENIYGLENLMGLEALPEKGAWIIALPMKIRNGSGGPARVAALLP